MANICSFEMKISGRDEGSVRKLVDYLKADYWYTDKDLPPKLEDAYPVCYKNGRKKLYMSKGGTKHFFRIENVDAMPIFKEGDGFATYAYGCCAHSVWTCMFSGEFTYFSDIAKNVLMKQHATNMEEATRELGLKVQIYSSEPGLCFEEHYIVDNGEIVVNEEASYSEYYFDPDRETFEEFRTESGLPDTVTKDDLDECNCIVVRTFDREYQ